MKKLNKEVFSNDSSTDTIAFPLKDVAVDGVEYLGELVINQDEVLRNARKYEVGFDTELARVVAHGVLHLLGYTDATSADRERMALIEDAVIDQLEL